VIERNATKTMLCTAAHPWPRDLPSLSQNDTQESHRRCTVLLHGDMNCSTLRRNNALDFMVDLIDRIFQALGNSARQRD
jgi:hypothetical protein